MNTHFRRFKMLALRTMAGDALKDDVNDTTSIFKGLMTFCMRVQCMMKISIVQNTRTEETAINNLRWVLSDHVIFKLTYGDVVRVSVMLGVASQLPKLWQNTSGSTGKQEIF